jgi:acetylornithine/succinyldiaminopimelate/putrescine aminotransferase
VVSSSVGERLVTGLRTIALDLPRKVKEVRAPLGDKALYAGVQFHQHAQVGPVVAAALASKVMVIGAGDNGDVLRICPPLSLTVDEVDAALVVLRQAIETSVPDYAGDVTGGAGK